MAALPAGSTPAFLLVSPRSKLGLMADRSTSEATPCIMPSLRAILASTLAACAAKAFHLLLAPLENPSFQNVV